MTRTDRWLVAGFVGLSTVAAILLSVVLVQLSTAAPAEEQARVATPAATPTSTTELIPMGAAHIPTTAACVLCHESGGSVGLKRVPALAHPLEGWTSCTACHSDNRLVKTAPGHVGIAEAECLNCHKTAALGPAITRPHSLLQNANCLGCHGRQVHLPETMVTMAQSQCWLCHVAADEAPPQFPHRLDTSRTCLSCHTAGKVGALPGDHAGRADSTCTLCHAISPAATAAPTAPHSLSGRSELCAFCHGPAPGAGTR